MVTYLLFIASCLFGLCVCAMLVIVIVRVFNFLFVVFFVELSVSKLFVNVLTYGFNLLSHMHKQKKGYRY